MHLTGDIGERYGFHSGTKNVRSFESRNHQHTMFHVSTRILLRHGHNARTISLPLPTGPNKSFNFMVHSAPHLSTNNLIKSITLSQFCPVSNVARSLRHMATLLVILSFLITSLAQFLCQPQKIRNYTLHYLVDISCYVSAST